jgi:ADP-heptose:LPS heptosyltransferase
MKPALLIFEQRMMGDAIMSLPFVRAALEGYEVYVTCAPGSVPVYEMVLPRDRIIPWTPPWLAEEGKYDRKRWAESGLREYLMAIKAVRPQVAVSVWADSRVHWLMAMCGAKKRVGFPMVKQNYYANHLPWRQRQLRLGKVLSVVGTIASFKPLLNMSLERRSEQQHHVVCWQQLAQALLLPWRDAAPWLMPPPATFPDEVQRAIEDARSAGQVVWMAHAGARLEAHRWPVENFERVLREELQAKGAKVILLDSPEVVWSGPLKHTFPSCRAKDVPSLFAAMAHADALLCNDTGVSHVAAALGKPVVSVFSASNPDWFAPWGSQQRAVRRQVCEFHPCFGRCQQPSYICRDSVTVEMVSKSVRQLQGELAGR